MTQRKPVFPGVYWYPRTSRWRAQIRVKGKVTHLGYFKSKSLACVTFNANAKEVYGSLWLWWQIRRQKPEAEEPELSKPVLEALSKKLKLDEEVLLKELFGK